MSREATTLLLTQACVGSDVCLHQSLQLTGILQETVVFVVCFTHVRCRFRVSPTELFSLGCRHQGPGWDRIVRELEVLMIRGQVHPLGLPKHQKGAQSQVADDGHQVKNTRPGASGLNQVATQTHAYHTWTREAEAE